MNTESPLTGDVPKHCRRLEAFYVPTGRLAKETPMLAQCESKVFFPDNPSQRPQFNDCPRRAETVRRVGSKIVKLCSKCASVWDEKDGKVENVAGVRDLR